MRETPQSAPLECWNRYHYLSNIIHCTAAAALTRCLQFFQICQLRHIYRHISSPAWAAGSGQEAKQGREKRRSLQSPELPAACCSCAGSGRSCKLANRKHLHLNYIKNELPLRRPSPFDSISPASCPCLLPACSFRAAIVLGLAIDLSGLQQGQCLCQ